MYDEVLKFGAKIVDELTKYDMPVFVYIPPGRCARATRRARARGRELGLHGDERRAGVYVSGVRRVGTRRRFDSRRIAARMAVAREAKLVDGVFASVVPRGHRPWPFIFLKRGAPRSMLWRSACGRRRDRPGSMQLVGRRFYAQMYAWSTRPRNASWWDFDRSDARASASVAFVPLPIRD